MSVLIYVASSFGLGHFVRAKAQADALMSRSIPVDVAYTGIPIPRTFFCARRTVELGCYATWPHFERTQFDAQLIAERSAALRRCVEEAQPALLLLEYVPFSKAYLIPEVLEAVQTAKRLRAHVVCTVRDFVATEPLAVCEQSAAARRVCESLDAVIVHGRAITGDQSWHEWSRKFQVPVHYCGAIVSAAEQMSSPSNRVQLSVGGGADGVTTIRAGLESAAQVGHEWVVFPGPFAPEESRQILAKHSSDFPHIREGREEELRATGVARVQMGGYNSFWEAVADRSPQFLCPRDRREQRLRASLGQQLGGARCWQSSDELSTHLEEWFAGNWHPQFEELQSWLDRDGTEFTSVLARWL